MSEKRKIVVNTLANGIAQFAAMLSALVFMPFLIHGFGTTDYGLYLLASSVVGYAGLLDFGVGTSLVKLTAEAVAQDDRERLGRLTSSTLAFYTLIGVIIALIMVALAFNAGALFKVDADGERLLRNLMLVAAGASLLAWPANTGSAILAGFQRYTHTARVSLGVTIATILVTAGVVIAHEGPIVLMIGVVLVNLGGGLTNAFLARKVLTGVRVSLFHTDRFALKAIFSFSWAVFVAQLCTIIIYQQTDRLVLGVFVGAAAIALYDAAGKFQGLMAQLTSFAVSALMPMASQLDAEGRRDALRTLFLRGTKYTLILLGPVVIVLMVVARPLLLAWLGPEFASVAIAAQILISHQILTSGTAVGDVMIVGLGKLPRRLPYLVGLAVLNLLLSLVLVRYLGILGVVLGTAIPYFIDYPLHIRLLLKTIDVPPSRWIRETVMPTYPLLLVPLGTSMALVATPLSGSLLGIAALGAFSVSLYWVAVYFWGLDGGEREEVRSGVKALIWRALDLTWRPRTPVGASGAPLVSIVIVTFNRVRMLQLCIASVLQTTHGLDCEIIVWDNASTDGTAPYLDGLAAADPRLQIVHSSENIGLNGVARGVALARGAYVVEIDDDVIDFPTGWLADMIHAFQTVPRAGYLAANVVQDELTNGAKPPIDQYHEQLYGDVVIEHGPTGGWCSITSRAVISRIGNFAERPGTIFFFEDADFGGRCARAFYRVGVVRDVRVYHACGPKANLGFGCIDVCEAKYSAGSEFQALLDETRRLKQSEGDK